MLSGTTTAGIATMEKLHLAQVEKNAAGGRSSALATSRPEAALSNFDPGVYSTIQALIWPVLIFFLVVCVYRRQVRSMLKAFERRLYLGGSVKIGSLELGSSYIGSSTIGTIEPETLCPRKDAEHEMDTIREAVYADSRRVFPVHRLLPSKSSGQLYDVIIYLVSHRSSLLNVEKVEYYLGRSWNDLVFTSHDRARGFPITLSAWGTFLCLARVHFVGGGHHDMYRFVDFEMGAVGPDASTEKLTPKASGAADTARGGTAWMRWMRRSRRRSTRGVDARGA